LPAGAIVKLNMLPEKKIIVLVTKEYHCLADILIRNQFKTLGASVQCVISNHATLQTICERFEVPFHLVSHEQKEKEIFEEELLGIIHKYEMDYLVLAKFMRILSPQFAKSFLCILSISIIHFCRLLLAQIPTGRRFSVV
jgi:formyltetrahydrofolate deformylase